MNSLRKSAQRAESVLAFDDTGFSSAGEPPWQAAWSEVKRITAYKVDRLTVDEIRGDFAFQDGIIRVITEECPGFEALMLELGRRFPSMSDWRSRVVQPAFTPCVSVLYERGDGLSAATRMAASGAQAEDHDRPVSGCPPSRQQASGMTQMDEL